MENRKDFERFAVQYWGQDVITGDNIGIHEVDAYSTEKHSYTKLVLRSIESLTATEKETVYRIHYGRIDYTGEINISKDNIWWVYKLQHLRPPVLDYLRSIGILVPFDKYSVEQILSLGWAVVKK